MTALNLDGNAPPDWMNFSRTVQVAWPDVEAMVLANSAAITRDYDLLVAILRAGAPMAALIGKHTGLPIDYLLCNRRNP